MSDVRTLNLSEADDGMVSLKDNPSTNFVAEKNVNENKETMDSTLITDVMGPQEMSEPPMMAMMQQQQQQVPQMVRSPQVSGNETPTKKSNPMNLTDEQMQALVVALCTAVAISKPVQEKLAGSVPKFLNAQGNRSMVGLAVTGLVAAVIFYFAKRYV